MDYRLLNADLTAALMSLRIQGAVNIRRAGRRSLAQFAAHEWSHLQGDAIGQAARLQKQLMELLPEQSLPRAALLDTAAVLEGTLEGDIALPLIIRRPELAYFSSRPPAAYDIDFIRILFQWRAICILKGCQSGQIPYIDYSFACPAFPELDCKRMLNVDGEAASTKKAYDDMLKAQGAPWPLNRDQVGSGRIDMRNGLLSILTLAPRELLRNAIEHGSGERIDFDVCVEVRLGASGGRLVVTVSNRLSPEVYDPDEKVEAARVACNGIHEVLSLVDFEVMADMETKWLTVKCTIKIGDH
jgi:hypothetical protein